MTTLPPAIANRTRTSTGRVLFGSVPEILPIPDLLADQRASYEWFRAHGLAEALRGLSPIVDHAGHLELTISALPDSLGQPDPTRDPAWCRAHNATYAAPLRARLDMLVVETGEILQKTIFLADVPVPTPEGTFIVNGGERTIVSQVVRAPGVYLTRDIDRASGRILYGAKVAPMRGAHLTFESTRAGVLRLRINRSPLLPATALLRVLLAGPNGRPVDNDEILELFADVDTHPERPMIDATLERDKSEDTYAAALAVWRRLRPHEGTPPEDALKNVLGIFSERRYDLVPVGRHTLDRRLAAARRETPVGDVDGDPRLLRLDDLVAIMRVIVAAHAAAFAGDGPPADVVDHMANRRVRGLGELLVERMREGFIFVERGVKDRMTLVEATAAKPTDLINIRPVQKAINSFFAASSFSQFRDEINPLSSLKQKRTMTAMGRGGLKKGDRNVEARDVHPTHYGRLCPIETPEGPNIGLVTRRPVYARIDEMGFIRAPYRVLIRTLSSHDPRLIGRAVTQTVPSIIATDGRPIPELAAGHLVTEALAERWRAAPSVEVCVRPFASGDIVYLDAFEEIGHTTVPATTPLNIDGTVAGTRVAARRDGAYVDVPADQVDLLDVSPRQIISPSTALIPFSDHNDKHRDLMGTNMQSQAVPLLHPQAPVVGTGMEIEITDKGHMLLTARRAGVVVSATKAVVIVRAQEDGVLDRYPLCTFARTNQYTTVNERPLVLSGQHVAAGDPLADTAATKDGELALGQNVLVAYMAWEGGNFEDGVLLSRRLVDEERFASVHAQTYEIDVHETPAGPEQRRRAIPGAARTHVKKLDRDGLAMIGARMAEGDILVGKMTPRLFEDASPEERLLATLYPDDNDSTWKDTSLHVKPGKWGVVTRVSVLSRLPQEELPRSTADRIFTHVDRGTLPLDVLERVEVTLTQRRQVAEGDKMAGRHGNKGVIARVVPEHDMPYLADGTPVDIVLNSLGVPSRMNLGQILETHLGWAAHTCGLRVATPVFDGARAEEIRSLLMAAGLPEDGKATLYDGRTGEAFHQPVTVGVKYMLKLNHLVEDKMHARSTGPYTLTTQQPTQGKGHKGGQRAGEMEIWALESYGAAYLLREMLTVKSDAVEERETLLADIVRGHPRARSGVPATLTGLIREARALALDLDIAADGTRASIHLASPDMIRAWSSGEITKPETVDLKTNKPIKDGLFCEEIFGQEDAWRCACGGLVGRGNTRKRCGSCGERVRRATARRDRMAHIELAAPCTHLWYLKGMPGRIALLLDATPRQLEKVVYQRAEIVIAVDEEGRAAALDRLSTEPRRSKTRDLVRALRPGLPLKPAESAILAAVAPEAARLGSGGRAIHEILQQLDLERLAEELRARVDAGAATGDRATQKAAIKRLRVVTMLRRGGIRPEWMVLTALPVMPPDLRPIIAMADGRTAVADVTELYRKVVYRNTRLRALQEQGFAPASVLGYEEALLQRAVDALVDNVRTATPVTGPTGLAFRSLSDALIGKEGRLRKNLLGKRVDYSGRSVIIANPGLLLHQCGLPKRMALELYRPFVMHFLIVRGKAANALEARRLIDARADIVWDALDAALVRRPVLLNRSPSLHRFSLQAFLPVLVEGSAIHVHPLVCSGFNADFDGDQMAVHLPISEEARLEALDLMLAARNIMAPSDGEPIVSPSKDMVMGCCYLTAHLPGEADAHNQGLMADEDARGRGARWRQGPRGSGAAHLWPRDGEVVYADWEDAIAAQDTDRVGLHTLVWVRVDARALQGVAPGQTTLETTVGAIPLERIVPIARPGVTPGGAIGFLTTPGRILFNRALAPVDASTGAPRPSRLPFADKALDKGSVKDVIGHAYRILGPQRTAVIADIVKTLGFAYVTRSGISFALSDIPTPPHKAAIIAAARLKIEPIDRDLDTGAIDKAEGDARRVAVWKDATKEIEKDVEAQLDQAGPLYMMVKAKAIKGNFTQVNQLAGFRGVMKDTAGNDIPVPILSCFCEGIGVLESYISCHGTRNGLVNTALGTAQAGYLTRRLVDTGHAVVVRADDCGATTGIEVTAACVDGQKPKDARSRLRGRVLGRVPLAPIVGPDGAFMAYAGEPINDRAADRIATALLAGTVACVRLRSPLTCAAPVGICRLCYGWSLDTRHLVRPGTAVGILAAQSLGEPGTQLTLRSFHTGGVSTDTDITEGLPRVEELLEMRPPKRRSYLAPLEGTLAIETDEEGIALTITSPYGDEETLTVPATSTLAPGIAEGATVSIGDALTTGSPYPPDVLATHGLAAAMACIVNGVQDVYRSQDVAVVDAHVETIVRQMFRQYLVSDPGDTGFYHEELVERAALLAANTATLAQGGSPALGRAVVLGMTKAALAVPSFLSAASFQETTRILSDAALEGKVDPMLGLKETTIAAVRLAPIGLGLHPPLPDPNPAAAELRRPAAPKTGGSTTASAASEPCATPDSLGKRGRTSQPRSAAR